MHNLKVGNHNSYLNFCNSKKLQQRDFERQDNISSQIQHFYFKFVAKLPKI